MSPLVGRVIRTKSAKTAMVQVARRIVHPLYGKEIIKRRKFMIHDEEEKCNVGDIVQCVCVIVIGGRHCTPLHSAARARRSGAELNSRATRLPPFRSQDSILWAQVQQDEVLGAARNCAQGAPPSRRDSRAVAETAAQERLIALPRPPAA